jgi:hypothetical protein
MTSTSTHTRALRYVNMRSLERYLGPPTEQQSHFQTSALDGRPTTVTICRWSCGCQALSINPNGVPYSPCSTHEPLAEEM